jgi:shikimate dehydrogenase
VVGVIGSPIRQSLSPLLHNAAFGALGVNWVSLAFEVVPGQGQVAAALGGMRSLGVAGLSVTMPHKAEVEALVDTCTEVAARLGSVNCIINEGGQLRGANTDGDGFLASLRRAAEFDPTGKRCLVVGAGGAARAVVYALAQAGAADVAVVNRTAPKAEDVAALAGSVGRAVPSADAAQIAQADLVVNATSVGMAGVGPGTASVADDWLVSPALFHAGQVVTDLIYAPRVTPWLEAARDSGATTVGGLGMLVHQAAAQITLWTGLVAPVDVMWQAATQAA